MVILREKAEADFVEWNERVWRLYREELIQAGSSEDAADENIRETIASTMEAGLPRPGNFVFDVFDGETVIGNVWLNDRNGEWFIYDIEVLEAHQGKGLGRATMKAIEEYVRQHGGHKIGLSVFGFNKVAQNLYLSEGYEIKRLFMSKDLE